MLDLAGGIVVIRGAKGEQRAKSLVEACLEGAREARLAVSGDDAARGSEAGLSRLGSDIFVAF